MDKPLKSNSLKVAFYTFGCKVNLFETDQLKKSLKNVEVVDPDGNPDIFVINSCAVTAAAESQVRNMIRRFEKRGEVIVTGCYARKKGVCKVGSAHFIPTVEEVASYFGQELFYDASFSRSRPFVKIQSGCDRFCSYCIIPLLRGSLKSVPLNKIKQLLQKIKEENFKETVLTGIHIGKYGQDLNDGTTLADVVKAAFDAVGRVRLGSLESLEIDERLFEYAKNGMILPHWHIPLQSGCDAILKKMNRPYKSDDFKRVVEKIVAAYKEVPAIGTDIIAGFPSESDKDFEQTRKFVESLPFSYGHVFPFSARAGTAAEKMERESPVPQPVKKERAQILREILALKKQAFKKSLDSLTEEVIVEEKRGEKLFKATSSRYQSVKLSGNFHVRELVKVKLSFKEGELFGVPLDSSI